MTKVLNRFFPVYFYIWAVGSLSAQSITGDWYGLLNIQGRELRLVLHVQSRDDGYAGALDSPDQGAFGLPADEVTFRAGKLAFRMAQHGISFEGDVDAGYERVTGTFSQGGARIPLVLRRTELAAPPGSPEWLRPRLTKREVMIPMRDGVRLFTSIYVPRDTTRQYPILLWRTPYNSEPDSGQYTARLSLMTHLLEAGYILAFQDVRGKYQSEGAFEDVRPFNPNKKTKRDIDENSDTYDAIDWLVKNVPHNNGRVGIFGISYPGFYATMSLPDAHPALRAVSPQAPVTDWFIGDDFHHNGAFFLMDAFAFYSSFGRPRPEPTRKSAGGFNWPMQDNYRFFLELGPIKNVRTQYFGDTIQFWSDLMSHPNYDAFWKARDVRPHLKNIRPAVLTVGGWFDAEDSFGPLRTYEAIEKQSPPTAQNRLIIGPWFHGQWASGRAENLGNVHWGFNTAEYYKQVEKNFFDYYLKDEGAMDLPEATIFITGDNEWRRFDTWPPRNVTQKSLYFQPAGALTFAAPTATAESFDEYVSDPMKPVPYTEDVHLQRTREYMTDDQRFAARRPDVMVYQTGVLSEDVTLTGPLTADLWVSTTGTDADYVVKLIDVFPDTLSQYPENDKGVPMAGYQMLVRGEVFRGRFRNSFEKPEPFVPGRPTQVRFETPDVAHTFRKGHRIMIQVQNSWFPLVDRNPQTFVDIYQAEEKDFRKATQRIYHDRQRPSRLQVWVLEE